MANSTVAGRTTVKKGGGVVQAIVINTPPHNNRYSIHERDTIPRRQSMSMVTEESANGTAQS